MTNKTNKLNAYSGTDIGIHTIVAMIIENLRWAGGKGVLKSQNKNSPYAC